MAQAIGGVTILVHDYDEAIGFYVGRLGFAISADADLGHGKRWLMVRPPGTAAGTALLLARAEGGAQSATVGRQGGGRVMLFLHTDDFRRDHAAFTERGVHFVEEPRHEPYGWVAVFEDLYGNRWDLIEPIASPTGGDRPFAQFGVQDP